MAVVVGQTARDMAVVDAVPIKTAKSLPTYSAVLPKYKILAEESVRLDGRSVRLRVKAYPPENYAVEAIVDVLDIFSPELHRLRDQMITLAERRLRKLEVMENFKEEYAIFTVAGYKGEPQQFLPHAREIVGLIRSENLPLAEHEVQETIKNSSLQYTAHDLTILDWDGAFCFDPDGNWHETIELLEVANVHLLRLRVLDHELDRRLESMTALLRTIPRRRFLSTSSVQKQMAALLALQVRSIDEFSHSGRDIQLIGDWYAAKLYNLISRKFHLAEWRTVIKTEELPPLSLLK